ncbi:hypothetical protein M3Y97_01144400 [Aphelenchoides bicaudatus]|nr:hypothetical protein M3Y97_01144400 [Aphelenchoides bicaudatus]
MKLPTRYAVILSLAYVLSVVAGIISIVLSEGHFNVLIFVILLFGIVISLILCFNCVQQNCFAQWFCLFIFVSLFKIEYNNKDRFKCILLLIMLLIEIALIVGASSGLEDGGLLSNLNQAGLVVLSILFPFILLLYAMFSIHFLKCPSRFAQSQPIVYVPRPQTMMIQETYVVATVSNN